ncbi:MAG TPA: hypothetical protein VFF73_03555 [Planctomycetota bacterium]|nr:hypothetical protein [Planctomycetota bacterium]
MSPDRPTIALVSAHDRGTRRLRAALEAAGYDVVFGYAPDFRNQTTAFATFVETWKPDVIVVELTPPADDALKDLLTFKTLRQAEKRKFVLVCSDEEMRTKLPEHVCTVALKSDDPAPVVKAVVEALADRQAA